MKDRLATYEVTVVVPNGYSLKDMRRYLEDAISCWSGGYDPDDPLFGHFDDDTLKIKRGKLK